MSPNQFDPEVCQRACREKLAPVYGWPAGEFKLDERLEFYLRLVHDTGKLSAGHHLLDLGPGLSAFGSMAWALGMEVTLVDDFGGGGGVEIGNADPMRKVIEAWKSRLGIRVLEQDFVAQPLPVDSATVDVATCFHSLEHWHHSPKRLFCEIARVLRPGGFLIIATPNAANLRKRIYVPLGNNIGPTLEEWYHEGDPVFRGHVREPIVHDLRRLLEWNDFDVTATHGRNFIGGDSIALSFLPKPVVRSIAAISGRVLRYFPTLCSDIHVVGRKRA